LDPFGAGGQQLPSLGASAANNQLQRQHDHGNDVNGRNNITVGTGTHHLLLNELRQRELLELRQREQMAVGSQGSALVDPRMAMLAQQQQSMLAQPPQGLLAPQHHGLLAQQQQGLLVQQQQGLLAQQQQGLLAQHQQGLLAQQQQGLLAQQQQGLLAQHQQGLLQMQGGGVGVGASNQEAIQRMLQIQRQRQMDEVRLHSGRASFQLGGNELSQQAQISEQDQYLLQQRAVANEMAIRELANQRAHLANEQMIRQRQSAILYQNPAYLQQLQSLPDSDLVQRAAEIEQGMTIASHSTIGVPGGGSGGASIHIGPETQLLVELKAQEERQRQLQVSALSIIGVTKGDEDMVKENAKEGKSNEDVQKGLPPIIPTRDPLRYFDSGQEAASIPKPQDAPQGTPSQFNAASPQLGTSTNSDIISKFLSVVVSRVPEIGWAISKLVPSSSGNGRIDASKLKRSFPTVVEATLTELKMVQQRCGNDDEDLKIRVENCIAAIEPYKVDLSVAAGDHNAASVGGGVVGETQSQMQPQMPAVDPMNAAALQMRPNMMYGSGLRAAMPTMYPQLQAMQQQQTMMLAQQQSGLNGFNAGFPGHFQQLQNPTGINPILPQMMQVQPHPVSGFIGHDPLAQQHQHQVSMKPSKPAPAKKRRRRKKAPKRPPSPDTDSMTLLSMYKFVKKKERRAKRKARKFEEKQRAEEEEKQSALNAADEGGANVEGKTGSLDAPTLKTVVIGEDGVAKDLAAEIVGDEKTGIDAKVPPEEREVGMTEDVELSSAREGHAALKRSSSHESSKLDESRLAKKQRMKSDEASDEKTADGLHGILLGELFDGKLESTSEAKEEDADKAEGSKSKPSADDKVESTFKAEEEDAVKIEGSKSKPLAGNDAKMQEANKRISEHLSTEKEPTRSDCPKPPEDGKPNEEGNSDKLEASSSDKASTVSTVSESTAETQKDGGVKNVESTEEETTIVKVKEDKSDDDKKKSEDDKVDDNDSKPVGRVDRKDVANALLGLNGN